MSDPVPLRDALVALGRDLGVEHAETLLALEQAWRDAVGDDVARHARPAGVRGGTLTIEVDGAEWATQLRYLEGTVLRRLEAALGGHALERTRIVVRRPGSRR